jgi:hypothetical protein
VRPVAGQEQQSRSKNSRFSTRTIVSCLCNSPRIHWPLAHPAATRAARLAPESLLACTHMLALQLLRMLGSWCVLQQQEQQQQQQAQLGSQHISATGGCCGFLAACGRVGHALAGSCASCSKRHSSSAESCLGLKAVDMHTQLSKEASLKPNPAVWAPPGLGITVR